MQKIAEKVDVKVTFLLLAFAWIALAGVACLSAQQSGAGDTLRFAVIDSKPFGYVDTDGVTKGVHYELIGELAKRTGLNIERRIYPYARMWSNLENGLVDAAIGWRSSERDPYSVYVNFVFTDYLSAITMKNKQTLGRYEDLYTVGTVGVLRGLSISDKFNADTRIQKYDVNTYDQGIEMLRTGKVDAVAGNVYAFLYLASQFKLTDSLDLPGLKLGSRDQWLQASKKSKMLRYVPQLQKAVQAMISDGYVEKIFLKYYGDDFKKIRFNK